MSADDLRTARRLLTAAIVALVLGAVLTLLDGVVATVWGVGAALGSLAVTWMCSWRASRFMQAGLPYYLWKYLPAALLVGLPVAFRLVRLLRRDGGGLGPMELLNAISENRKPRLDADFALHLNEVTLAIQDAGATAGAQIMKTTCAPIDPMPWAIG